MVIKLTLKKPSGALPKKSCKHVGFYTEVEENDFGLTKAVKSFKDADFTDRIRKSDSMKCQTANNSLFYQKVVDSTSWHGNPAEWLNRYLFC